MSWECPKCFFVNEDEDKFCAMCNEPREEISSPSAPEPVVWSSPVNIPEPAGEGSKTPTASNQSFRYIINCPTSGYKTVVDSPSVTEYYCKGCDQKHPVDNMLWAVEKESLETVSDQMVGNPTPIPNNNGEHLVLEDVDTHYRIEIDRTGGTIGRYGKYGAAYFQSDPRGRMVSGEHCRIKYEYGKWSIEHLSKTNDTVYNGRKLEHGFEEGIRDGKILTLANIMSFVIRIF